VARTYRRCLNGVIRTALVRAGELNVTVPCGAWVRDWSNKVVAEKLLTRSRLKVLSAGLKRLYPIGTTARSTKYLRTSIAQIGRGQSASLLTSEGRSSPRLTAFFRINHEMPLV
jgi:hypothetical protein